MEEFGGVLKALEACKVPLLYFESSKHIVGADLHIGLSNLMFEVSVSLGVVIVT